jgi:hypothetical protein
MQRWIGFLLAIALGIAAGLYYGWVVNPVEYVDTTPDTLRIDYQADFVLMIAEIYQADGNIENAARKLALLGDTPVEITQKTMEYAAQAGYGHTELTLLTALQDGLQNWNPAVGDTQ